MTHTRPVVYIVSVSLAFVFVSYGLTLSILSFLNISPDPKVLEYLKDAGIFAAGGLVGLLAQTRNPGAEGEPTKTEITNTPSNPVPTTEERTPSND